MNLHTPLKVLIEFDLSREADRDLMNIITQVKGAQAKGLDVSLGSIINQIKSHERPGNIAEPLEKAGKKLTEVTNELQSKLGDDRKLTTRERASVAAKAKWAKYRAEQAGLPVPPPAPRRKKAKKKEADLSKAEKLAMTDFPMNEADEEVLFNGSNFVKRPAIPDGREIIEGSFDDEEVIDSEEDNEIQLSDEYRRGIHEKARDFER
jgi:hypothetical protein